MIFIENKKAWKELIRLKEYQNQDKPSQFPLYCFETQDEDGDTFLSYLYKSDLQSMIDKIDSGREF